MDPLANLNDIHLPEQISSFPIAPGWWLLLFVVVAALCWLAFRLLTKHRYLRPYQQAVIELEQLEKPAIIDSMRILKWVAMHYFDRRDFAPYYAEQLLTALTDKLPQKHQQTFLHKAQNALTHQYHPKADQKYGHAMQQAALFWLEHVNITGAWVNKRRSTATRETTL
ncbi:DUF4381 domain-containing protein [Thalassotalea ponticola]|uniref:DUF4381 domain-containing protein n=1 Tax=Thalassotalea ponticola TaxID=1523392 RepID=UPI0025B47D2F|nr:DUF4381 domain-containing protein [Thalassotalea ponticola]MDN3651646.1 DUF4381 domain-containing protein [Thalassotalea ponticola]